MHKKILLLIIGAILLMPATVEGSYCLNTSWEREPMVIDGTGRIIDTYCPYNCSNQTQRCNPGYPAPIENIMIVGGLILVAALLLFLGIKLKEKHWVMQYFFMFIALYLILTAIYFIFNLQTLSWTQVSDIMTTNYTAILYTVILFLFYFLLQIIINATRHMTGGKKE